MSRKSWKRTVMFEDKKWSKDLTSFAIEIYSRGVNSTKEEFIRLIELAIAEGFENAHQTVHDQNRYGEKRIIEHSKKCNECQFRYSPVCKYCELDGTCPDCAIKMKWNEKLKDWNCPKCGRLCQWIYEDLKRKSVV